MILHLAFPVGLFLVTGPAQSDLWSLKIIGSERRDHRDVCCSSKYSQSTAFAFPRSMVLSSPLSWLCLINDMAMVSRYVQGADASWGHTLRRLSW
jgi:hypothetical protein